ncbi:hypothetical protein DFH27DRAFT_546263 [Peziza echinospora]|nr:hypothetical protein DFH27DRAFT_546263 [Peziza echinospora]
MPFNTFTVACATTPTVISTLVSHYLNPKPLASTPSSHISYHEGVALVRRFLEHASHHTVEELQAFTAQYVPHPTWVHTENVEIPAEHMDAAAAHIAIQLGASTLAKIGGERWWRWRERPLRAEWVEMRRDHSRRLKHPEERPRTMLYVHGGAYYFGSVDEHRYQLQRHARKLQARVFAPRYRLAPQFPFPCALHDVLACYLYLLTVQSPATIVFAGDSAGGGLVLSLLVVLRDQGLPLPAGAVLISPWVDLCHSFPSVVSDNSKDYIPAHGFQHRPSAAWPPPTTTDLEALRKALANPNPPAAAPVQRPTSKAQDKDDSRGYTVKSTTAPSTISTKPTRNTSIVINGQLVTLTDQIQMYTTNDMISHPLVSPVNQGSLGGLPPLMVLVGGGEVLRDEQIYIAHKAADPKRWLPWEEYLDDDERQREAIDKWPPTKVMLQVYDDCCHVTPTLSFTRPAKHMFRAIAQFANWALVSADENVPASIAAHAALDPDNNSIMSEASSSSRSENGDANPATQSGKPEEEDEVEQEGKQQVEEEGEDEPPLFEKPTPQRRPTITNTATIPPFDPATNMIRQRISYKGEIFDLPPIPPPGQECALHDTSIVEDATAHPPGPPDGIHPYIHALTLPRAHIGSIKALPTLRWIEAKKLWDVRYAKQKRAVQKGWVEEVYWFERKKMKRSSAAAAAAAAAARRNHHVHHNPFHHARRASQASSHMASRTSATSTATTTTTTNNNNNTPNNDASMSSATTCGDDHDDDDDGASHYASSGILGAGDLWEDEDDDPNTFNPEDIGDNPPPSSLYRRMKMAGKQQARLIAQKKAREEAKMQRKGWGWGGMSMGLGLWSWMGEGQDRHVNESLQSGLPPPDTEAARADRVEQEKVAEELRRQQQKEGQPQNENVKEKEKEKKEKGKAAKKGKGKDGQEEDGGGGGEAQAEAQADGLTTRRTDGFA